MKKTLLAALLVGLAPHAHAADVEIEVLFGKTLPEYSQSFTYDPGTKTITLPGVPEVRLQQRGPFTIDGEGGSSLGASLTVYAARGLGFELRIDSGAVDIRSSGTLYHVNANLPAPLPDLSTDVALAAGTVNSGRLNPLSLNLKLATGGRVGVALSGGVSYLPTVRLSAEQSLGVDTTAIDPGLSPLSLGTVGFRAEVRPEDDDTAHRLGVNVGAGLRFNVSPRVALTAEARLFHFPEHQLQWTLVPAGPLSGLEQVLLDEVKGRIQPLDFNPTFYQATVGLALRF